MSGASRSREMILAAAEAVVLKHGAAHMTLDAVAKKAGVSKGGLLYHFRTKEALLQGMIAHRINQCNVERRQAEARFPRDKAAFLKAIVESGLDDNDPARKIHAAALAAVANEPQLLEPVKDHNKTLFAELSGFRDFNRASVVLLAVQGLWLMETLQTSPLTKRQRSGIVAEMLSLAESSARGREVKS